MNQVASKDAASARAVLTKVDPTTPALVVTGRATIAIKAGTTFGGHAFTQETPVALSDDLEPGRDYGVIVDGSKVGYASLDRSPLESGIVIGGFHFAPGGNAVARSGGDSVPAINPYSVWDLNFRFAGPDPRGMFLIETRRWRAWLDIYKLGREHLSDGTSKFGVTIADGKDPPRNPAGGYFKKLDYETAIAVMKHHGKTLASYEEFIAGAHGVTEKTAAAGDPKITGLDAPRTSQRGMMQATGNLWDWGHDGDPDMPRASIFGGSWRGGGYAGSRCASLAYDWPDSSVVSLGARGRGDHLQLV